MIFRTKNIIGIGQKKEKKNLDSSGVHDLGQNLVLDLEW